MTIEILALCGVSGIGTTLHCAWTLQFHDHPVAPHIHMSGRALKRYYLHALPVLCVSHRSRTVRTFQYIRTLEWPYNISIRLKTQEVSQQGK